MKSRIPALLTLAATLTLGAPHADATLLHDEAVDGDLSGDRFAPTAFVLTGGESTLSATSVAGDLEYVTITVPTGGELRRIFLDEFISTDDIAFIAVQHGTTFTEDPATANPANILGMAHFGTAAGTGLVGTNILDDIGRGFPFAPPIGFSPPLPSGPYTFWIQQTGQQLTTYTLRFRVVPEPSLAALCLGCLVPLGGVAARWHGENPRGRRSS